MSRLTAVPRRVAISPCCQRVRKGAIAVLMGLLLIPVLGMVAFAVDIGWIVAARAELQAAADASALGGAQMLIGQQQLNDVTGHYTLVNGFTSYYLPGQSQRLAIVSTATSSAILSAQAVAAENAAGNTRSIVLRSSDIQFGMTYADGSFTALSGPPFSTFPNTVKVTLRLDGHSNPPLPLFFAPVFGMRTESLVASAAATIYTGTPDLPAAHPGVSSRILPCTYDVNHWSQYLQTGLGPDGTRDVGSGSSTPLQVYPSQQFPGDWAWLSLDQHFDSSGTINNWLRNGTPSTDLQSELGAGLLPLSGHPASHWDWRGGSFDDWDSFSLWPAVGDTFLMALFNPVNSGSADADPPFSDYQPALPVSRHVNFDVVQLTGVRLTSIGFANVHVEPAAILDPNVVITSSQPALPPAPGSASLPTVFTNPKLTQ